MDDGDLRSRYAFVGFVLDGYVAIYKNGNIRGQVGLDQFNVMPRAGGAPLRIGTRNLGSFFEGAIGDVAIYDYALTPGQISRTYEAMFSK